MSQHKTPWYLGDIGLFILIVTFIFVVWCMQGCQSAEPKQPEPMEPDTIEEPTVEPDSPEPPKETPEQVFCREWDACWAVYTDCQKTRTKDECFPAMEKCGVAAYRRLKKARGEG